MAKITRSTEEDAFFFDGLVSAKATLTDLLSNGAHARNSLGTPWLDYGILRERIERAIGWVCEEGWQPRKVVNIFFQGSDDECDASAWKRALMHNRFLPNEQRELLQALPPEIAYLHTSTTWSGDLEFTGERQFGRWGVPSLRHYASIRPSTGFQLRPTHLTLGFQIPNLPALLGVSAEIASEYLARIVVHDILHYMLPQIFGEYEALHAATGIVAGGANPNACSVHSPWETFVRDECMDALFTFERAERIKDLRGQVSLTPLQYWYVDSLCEETFSKSPPYIRELFGISPGDSRERIEESIYHRLANERAQGFPGWVTERK